MTGRAFVVTGGPGSGKSTLIAALADEGFATMPEGGRAIIRDQQAIGGDALPWRDRAAFAQAMMLWDMRSWHAAQAMAGPVICDRGLPDVIGYRTLCGLPVPDALRRAAAVFRYERTVFIAPHWPAIFHRDAERRQDEAEAQATHDAMAATYAALGYELVALPRAPVAERVAFVRARIAG
ncbi:MAG: AAA family ATPase [Sphingomonas fennica]